MPRKLIGFRLEQDTSDRLKIYVIENKTTVQKLLEDYIENILKEGTAKPPLPHS